MSDHYSKSATFAKNTLARSGAIETEFTSVESGFDGVEGEVDLTIRVTGAGMTSFTLAESPANRATKILGFDSSGATPLLVSTASPETATTVDDPLPINKGGTNATDAATAIVNLTVNQSDWQFVQKITIEDNAAALYLLDSDGTAFESGHDHKIVFQRCASKSTAGQEDWQVRLGTGGVFRSGGTDYCFQSFGGPADSAVSHREFANLGYWMITADEIQATSVSLFGDLVLFDPANASTQTHAIGRVVYHYGGLGTDMTWTNFFGRMNSAQTDDEFMLYAGAAVNMQGTSLVYHFKRLIQ